MAHSQMVGDNFRLGYRFQRHWDWAMASAFFCGELGAGLFVVSMIFENAPGLVLGLLVTGIGKPIFHLTHMGVPEASWRAILRPDRSWTSRGLIALMVFIGAGTLHAIDVYLGHALPLGMVFQVLAAAAALGVMTYQGFAMSHSTAIALWNTAMIPALSLLYALTGGMAVILVLLPGSSLGGALPLAQGLLLADLIMLLCMVHAAYHGSPGARLSAQLLVKGLYTKWFLGVVVAAGLLLPLALLSLGSGAMMLRLAAAAGVLAGFYAFRVLIFKAGVYEPVMTFASPVDL
jgi:formate-dependent nitrite reductase membrane component NrfD